MAKARILAPWIGKEAKSAVYHCVSRVVERQFHFGKVEKEEFVKLMRIYEKFCGVKVLSFCVMSNHFHILLKVPPRPEQGISDEEILERVALVQQPENVALLREVFESYQGENVTEKGRVAYEALREQYLSRMWDLGKFMKFLKQRFSRWFNVQHKRKGTLWEERYSSSLVEDGYAALVTSAYIDLNPVRARMVNDPKDYRWSSYSEAVAGGRLAREGIAAVLAKKDAANENAVNGGAVVAEDLEGYGWRSIAGRYRVFLFEEGHAPGQSQQAKDVQGAKRSRRKGFSKEKVDAEKERSGELSVVAKLHCRTRSLIDGAVIGSRGFVEGVINELNEQRYWSKPRKTGGSCLRISRGVEVRDRKVGCKKDELKTNTIKPSQGGEALWSLRHMQKE
jgi:putative transposase